MIGATVIGGDCRAIMANMGDETVDSVCTDPPYHLTSIAKRFGPGQAPQQFGTDGAFARAARGFMGQTWDGGDVAFDPDLWREVFRVLKPGGHLVAFGGSRTYHRLACAIEDAGFEIRDQLIWLYGSGFPKSHAVDKAITALENHGGSSPRHLRRARQGDGYAPTGQEDPNGVGYDAKKLGRNDDGKETTLSPRAEQWAGYGTAVKPAHEPMVLARKPLVGSVAANVLKHGVGALNIDGCRVGTDGGAGRFPANVMHDGSDVVLSIFPSEAGAAAPVHRRGADKFRNTYGAFPGNVDEAGSTFHGDSGSAARFFYCAKASKRDREEGCEAIDAAVAGIRNGSGRHLTRGYDDVAQDRRNIHPTVKPTDLMRWVVRLVTPPGGLVFDPFTGSGSTGKAAILEGRRFLGAELTPEYLPIARARIAWAAKQAA